MNEQDKQLIDECRRGGDKFIIDLLFKYSFSVQTLNKGLVEAAVCGRDYAVALLLQAGAAPQRHEALLEATMCDRYEAVHTLLVYYSACAIFNRKWTLDGVRKAAEYARERHFRNMYAMLDSFLVTFAEDDESESRKRVRPESGTESEERGVDSQEEDVNLPVKGRASIDNYVSDCKRFMEQTYELSSTEQLRSKEIYIAFSAWYKENASNPQLELNMRIQQFSRLLHKCLPAGTKIVQLNELRFGLKSRSPLTRKS